MTARQIANLLLTLTARHIAHGSGTEGQRLETLGEDLAAGLADRSSAKDVGACALGFLEAPGGETLLLLLGFFVVEVEVTMERVFRGIVFSPSLRGQRRFL